jgi:hypothetical protein
MFKMGVVTKYKDIECPILNRTFSMDYCDMIQYGFNYGYGCDGELNESDEAVINKNRDDFEKSCRSCKYHGEKMVPIKSCYFDKNYELIGDWFDVDEKGKPLNGEELLSVIGFTNHAFERYQIRYK